MAADDDGIEDANPVEGQHLPARPIPPRRVRMPLATVTDCRRAMAQVIREARAGRLSTGDMTRYVYSLRELAKVVEVSELEERLEQLEARQREGDEAAPRAH